MALLNKRTYKKRVYIDNEEFVKAWMTQPTIPDIAVSLDLNVSQVSSKAHALRAKGVQLPKKVKTINEVDKLNRLIEKYNK